MTNNTVVIPENKSALFGIFFDKLPYPLASAIVRGIKVGLGVILPALLAALGDGTLINSIHILPASSAAIVGIIAGPIAVALEKYFREQGLINDVKNIPTSTVGTGPSETDTLADPPKDIPLT